MFNLDLKDVPTQELFERIKIVNEKTMVAPPHLREQLYQVFLALSAEYSTRTDK